MRILAKDLASHLTQSFNHFYFVYGEEPQQHQEALDLLRQKAKTLGFTERQTLSLSSRTTWDELQFSLKDQSLFGAKRLLECSLEEKITQATVNLLEKLTSLTLAPDLLIIIIASKIDLKQQKAFWFTQLERLKSTVCARPLSKEETLYWLKQRLNLAGFQATQEILALLWERSEGNLLAAHQTIEKLSLYHKIDPKNLPAPLFPLNIGDIQVISTTDAHFTVYDLIDAALLGFSERTSQILYSLKNKGIEPILINWAIAKEVRTSILLVEKWKRGAPLATLYGQHGVWKRREPMVQGFIQRMSLEKLHSLLKKSKLIDDMIKGRIPGNFWNSLLALLLMLTGVTLHE